jgi:predicted acetyltransferase
MNITKIKMSHLKAFEVYANECINDNLDVYKSAKNNYKSYLKKRIAYSEGKELPDGWPPMSLFVCIESGRIIGAIRIRHGINDYIENVIGHIGYETLPKVRGRGIATVMLKWVQENILEDIAIVTCNENNIASQKVIEKCGGLYLNNFYSKEEQREIRRYQIKST